jgi:hypothetical protein
MKYSHVEKQGFLRMMREINVYYISGVMHESMIILPRVLSCVQKHWYILGSSYKTNKKSLHACDCDS